MSVIYMACGKSDGLFVASRELKDFFEEKGAHFPTIPKELQEWFYL